MEKSYIVIVWNTAYFGGKRIEIWDSLIPAEHIWGIFDLVVLKVNRGTSRTY